MELSQIITGLKIIRNNADKSLRISGIAYDSRRVSPGNLFLAVPGFKVDGHDFVSQAAQAGAAAVVTERWLKNAGLPQIQVDNARRAMAQVAANFFGRPSEKLTLIGITGTNGKTTSTFLVDSILRTAGKRTGLIGGIEYRNLNSSVTASRTTPEAPDIQEILAKMVKNKVEAATMEVSSHGIELYRVWCLSFDIAVFTNLTQDHLDLHGQMEDYFQSKRKLFVPKLYGNGKDNGKRQPLAAINIDDIYGQRLFEELKEELQNGCISFGTSDKAVIRAQNAQCLDWKTSFDLVTPAGSVPVQLYLPGSHNLNNALAAAAVSHLLKIPLDIIASGITALKNIPGRFEQVDVDAPFKVVVDYAHNEDGLKKTLVAAREITSGKLIVVFGCPGERDRSKRPAMGKVAGTLSDLAVLTTDDCYSEPPEQILNETEPGLMASGGRYLRIADRRRAIEAALEEAGPGDLVIIAGKGHETKQVLAEGPIPFNDKQTVIDIISSR